LPSDLSRPRALEIADALRELGTIEVKRFFGGSGLAVASVQFAFVIEGALYFRVDAETRPAFEAAGAAPFSYATRAGRITLATYFEVPADVVEDLLVLRRWAVLAHGAAVKARRPVTTSR
jgi:TfoX/Sxy family transcriptional regulator of competence genes